MMRVCPGCVFTTHAESFFCYLYAGDKSFVWVNSAPLGATVEDARGRAPRQQGEQRPIYRCCVCCAQNAHGED
eukprot:11199261-Lingulodinium_polyedra.AAC.1